MTALACRKAHAVARRGVVPVAGLIAAGLLAAGCGARDSSGTATAGASGECPAGDLKLTIGPGNGAAGSIYYPLEFTNTGSASCTMYGYPGVAFVTKAGGTAAGSTVLGEPAFRNAAFAPKLVTLAPSATAHASLQVQVAQSYPVGTCKPVTGHWLQVYPPGSRAAEYVRFTAVTCTRKIPSGSTLGIYAVLPGATGQ